MGRIAIVVAGEVRPVGDGWVTRCLVCSEGQSFTSEEAATVDLGTHLSEHHNLRGLNVEPRGFAPNTARDPLATVSPDVPSSPLDERVVVYSAGLCQASVCAPAVLTGEQVAALTQEQDPSGTIGGWQLDESPVFAGSQPNPSPCNQHEGERRHWLLSC